MSSSRNVWVAIVFAYYFALQLDYYVAHAHGIWPWERWSLSLVFWFAMGLLFGRPRPFITQTVTVLAYGFVMAATTYHQFTWVARQESLQPLTRALAMILFVILPAMFFISSADPYRLVYGLPPLAGGRVGSYLVLILSISEMFKTRFNEVAEHLLARGIDIRSRFQGVVYVHRYFGPVLLSVIQEAAYRQLYLNSLGCEFDMFPRIRARSLRISSLQQLALIGVLVLLIVRLLQ
jgi:hypothetical protein